MRFWAIWYTLQKHEWVAKMVRLQVRVQWQHQSTTGRGCSWPVQYSLCLRPAALRSLRMTPMISLNVL